MGGGGVPEQLVGFEIAGRHYALPLDEVAEVVRMVALTPALDAPEWVAGLANLRGDVITVIDLRPQLGLARAEDDPDRVILIARTAQRTLGVLADRVVGVGDVRAGATVVQTLDLDRYA